MRRHSRASSEQARSRRPKSPKSKSCVPPEVAGDRPSRIGAETEVVRLRRQLHEAQEQQTATSNVFKIISRSTFDLKAVLDTLLQSAVLLCGAQIGIIFRPDGGLLRLVTNSGLSREAEQHWTERPPPVERGNATGRAVLDGRAVHIPDVLADPEYRAASYQAVAGYRTVLAVPMLTSGTTIGIVSLGRSQVNPFTDKQIELVTSFADQAVIAIEIARLLNELRQSLEQQTATAEVLGVISRSRFELQPILQSVVDTAARLCRADAAVIFRLEDGAYRFAAGYSLTPEYLEHERRTPIYPGSGTVVGRAAMSGQVARIDDALTDPFYEQKDAVKTGRARSLIGVPLMRGGEPIGVIGLAREQVEPFAEREIELVKTFADQSVIAIENARLLNELRDRTKEVERSYGVMQQQANQLKVQSQELLKLNQQLEQRVADQVGEIERMGRLRRFLPPQVADLIVASGAEKQLESHRREITALFCDLRGFTGFSEASAPEDVMALLRDYHTALGKIIIKYSGTLERFAGDGVMVIFNDPVPVDNPALQAVQMALETREAMGALTEEWRELGHDIGFGIGIAHGFATLGTIGFEGRFDYAAIGTVSNVASRLCDEAKPGQILISPRVLTKVENAVRVEPVGEFTLKGLRRPLAAYNVLGALSA